MVKQVMLLYFYFSKSMLFAMYNPFYFHIYDIYS